MEVQFLSEMGEQHRATGPKKKKPSKKKKKKMSQQQKTAIIRKIQAETIEEQVKKAGEPQVHEDSPQVLVTPQKQKQKKKKQLGGVVGRLTPAMDKACAFVTPTVTEKPKFEVSTNIKRCSSTPPPVRD